MRYVLALILASFCATANAQQYAPPQQPPVKYQIGWQYQPVATPGFYVAFPRYTNIGTAIFGPRICFIPTGPPQPVAPQQPQLPPPQQPFQPQQ